MKIIKKQDLELEFKKFCEIDGSVSVLTKKKYFDWFIELLKQKVKEYDIIVK